MHRVFSSNVITCLTEFNEYLIHFSISHILTIFFSCSTFELVLFPKLSPLTHFSRLTRTKKGEKLIYCWLTASLNLLDIQFLYPFFLCTLHLLDSQNVHSVNMLCVKNDISMLVSTRQFITSSRVSPLFFWPNDGYMIIILLYYYKC